MSDIFKDTQIAFRYKSDGQLKKSRWIFSLVAKPWISKWGGKFTQFALNIGLPIQGIIKRTIFSQFCGGESIAECRKTMKNLADYGVHSILDYSVEGKDKAEDYSSCFEMVSQTIEEAKHSTHIPFAVFKMTGILPFEILQKVSEKTQISKEERVFFEQGKVYFQKLCTHAKEHGVMLLVDAEESWIQPAIDALVWEKMLEHNTEKAVVYNTVQMYRHDRLRYLKNAVQLAKKHKIHYGVKLVRGAYMEKERSRAEDHGYPSPIQINKAATDRDFDAATEFCMSEHQYVALCLGTHNEKSSALLISLLKEQDVDLSSGRVYLAQLLGMSDTISFNAASLGCPVAKYVPFGPVKEVMPYLLRRAEENSSIAGQTLRELELVTSEIKRRKEKR